MRKRVRASVLCALTCGLLQLPTSAAAAKPAAEKSGDTVKQAKSLYEQGKYTEAAQIYDKLLNSQTKAHATNMKELVDVLFGYGRALMEQQKYEEAEKRLSEAQALAEALQLPQEFQRQIDADLHLVSQRVTPNVRRRHDYYYSGYNDQWLREGDPAEQEYLRKAAIEYTKQRFGLHSLAYLDRKLDYMKLLQQYQRKDDLAREASESAQLFAELPTALQVDIAGEMLQTAESLANSQLYVQADTLGNAVYRGIANGEWKTRAADIAAKMTRLAQSFDRQDTSELGQKYHAAAITAFEKQTTADNPELAKMRTALAETYKKLGKNGSAIELLELAAAAQSKNQATSGSDVVTTLSALADLYALTGNVAKTRETADKLLVALNASRQDTNNNATNSFKSLLNISEFLASKDDLPAAEKMYTASMMSLRKSRNYVSDWEVQRIVREAAIKFAEMGHPDQSEKLYDALIKARESALGLPTQQSFAAYLDKAQFFLDQEAFDQAEQAMTAGLAAAKQFPASSSDSRATEMAKKFADSKHYDIAIKMLQSWIDSSEDNRNVQQQTVVDAKVKLAQILADQGKKEEAKQKMTEIATGVMSQLPNALSPAREQLNSILSKLISANKFDQAGQILQALAQSHNYSRPEDAITRLTWLQFPVELQPEQLKLYELILDMVSKVSGPSSIQASSIMGQYANVLSMSGDAKKAEELRRASTVIQTLYQRQNETAPNGNSIYKPFAPLSETLGTQEAFTIKNGLRVPR